LTQRGATRDQPSVGSNGWVQRFERRTLTHLALDLIIKTVHQVPLHGTEPVTTLAWPVRPRLALYCSHPIVVLRADCESSASAATRQSAQSEHSCAHHRHPKLAERRDGWLSHGRIALDAQFRTGGQPRWRVVPPLLPAAQERLETGEHVDCLETANSQTRGQERYPACAYFTCHVRKRVRPWADTNTQEVWRWKCERSL